MNFEIILADMLLGANFVLFCLSKSDVTGRFLSETRHIYAKHESKESFFIKVLPIALKNKMAFEFDL